MRMASKLLYTHQKKADYKVKQKNKGILMKASLGYLITVPHFRGNTLTGSLISFRRMARRSPAKQTKDILLEERYMNKTRSMKWDSILKELNIFLIFCQIRGQRLLCIGQIHPATSFDIFLECSHAHSFTTVNGYILVINAVLGS